MENGTCYAYLLRCADGTLYAGWTNDPAARLAAHNDGRGAKYTRGRLPVEMVYREAFDTRAEAMRREWELKQMTRAQKLALIAHGAGGAPAGAQKRGCGGGPKPARFPPRGRAPRGRKKRGIFSPPPANGGAHASFGTHGRAPRTPVPWEEHE